jgi:hypothetical protein
MLAEMDMWSVTMGGRSKEFERECRDQLTVAVYNAGMTKIAKNFQGVAACPEFEHAFLSNLWAGIVQSV